MTSSRTKSDAPATLSAYQNAVRRRLTKRPSFLEACRTFLLEDDHPALIHSFRSRHFGGSLESEVMRLFGKRGGDPRLKRAWQWIVPLLLVWAFILFMVFFVLLDRMSLYNQLRADFENGKYLRAYSQFSFLVTFLVGYIILISMPLNHVIGSMVVRELRKSPRIADLALSAVTRRELATAFWMRCMVGSRVLEVMGALCVLNYFATMPFTMTMDHPTIHFVGFTGVIFLGALGARRGALDGVIAGMRDFSHGRLFWRVLWMTFARYLQLAIWGFALAVFLPLQFLTLLSLGVVDYPLLYLITSRRDFERLVALIDPKTLEEGISPDEWRQSRLEYRRRTSVVAGAIRELLQKPDYAPDAVVTTRG